VQPRNGGGDQKGPEHGTRHRKSILQLCKVVGEPYQTGKLVNGNFTIQLLKAALQNQNG
jgi:hypothetical protein